MTELQRLLRQIAEVAADVRVKAIASDAEKLAYSKPKEKTT